MISGEVMKKHILVRQQHRYTKERFILFDGIAEYQKNDDSIIILYKENDTKANVKIVAEDNVLKIVRKAEAKTTLEFREHKLTTGDVLSEFGCFTLDLHTHNYIKKENIIAIEYDIRSGEEVTDGFRIIWMVKEDVS